MAEKKPFYIQCLGGHGRTGTAAAILLYLLKDEHNPIEYLREAYCKCIVETETQVRYVSNITGLNLTDTAYRAKNVMERGWYHGYCNFVKG